MEVNNLKKLFEEFLVDNVKISGRREIISLGELVKRRKDIYNGYKNAFSSIRLETLTANDFRKFLKTSVNLTCPMHRSSNKLVSDMSKLKEVIRHLQNENIDFKKRLDDVLRNGELHIEGFGKNLATFLLHVFDWNKYGLWNGRSEKALRKLNRFPSSSNKNYGEKYHLVNEELKKLSQDIGIDLVQLDAFLWWLDDRNKI